MNELYMVITYVIGVILITSFIVIGFYSMIKGFLEKDKKGKWMYETSIWSMQFRAKNEMP